MALLSIGERYFMIKQDKFNGAANPEIRIDRQKLIIPKFENVLDDILNHRHTHYVMSGGRGSTKSSFLSEVIPLLLIQNPNCHAVVFRKVGNTMKNSVWAQIVWGIDALGLTEFFHIPKSIANPIVFKPTGQQILFFGLDNPDKIKSGKLRIKKIDIEKYKKISKRKYNNICS